MNNLSMTLLPASFCDLLLCSGVIFKMIWSGTLVRDHNLRQHVCSPKLVTLGIKVNRTNQILLLLKWEAKVTTRKDLQAAKKTKDINPLWGFVSRKPFDKKRTFIPLFEDGAVQWFD